MKIISQTSKEILISSPKTTFSEKFIGFILTFVSGSVFAFIPMSIVLISLSEIGVLKIQALLGLRGQERLTIARSLSQQEFYFYKTVQIV